MHQLLLNYISHVLIDFEPASLGQEFALGELGLDEPRCHEGDPDVRPEFDTQCLEELRHRRFASLNRLPQVFNIYKNNIIILFERPRSIESFHFS